MVHFAKLIINAFVGNSGHVLFGCEFDFTLVWPKTTHSTLTKQSDSEVLPLSISERLFQKVSRRPSVGRLRHLHLVCQSSLHASSFQTLSRLRSSPHQLSRLCSSRTIPYIFLSVFQDVRISVWSWATRLTFLDWDGSFYPFVKHSCCAVHAHAPDEGADTGDLRFLFSLCAVCVDTNQGRLGLAPTASRSNSFSRVALR